MLFRSGVTSVPTPDSLSRRPRSLTAVGMYRHSGDSHPPSLSPRCGTAPVALTRGRLSTLCATQRAWMTFLDWFLRCAERLGAHTREASRAAGRVMKHALSVHIATRMGAFARVPTALASDVCLHDLHMLTVALRPSRVPTNAKHLKKRHFSVVAREIMLAYAYACAIFRADSLYAETVAPRFMLTKFFSRSSSIWRKRVAHRRSRKS